MRHKNTSIKQFYYEDNRFDYNEKQYIYIYIYISAITIILLKKHVL